MPGSPSFAAVLLAAGHAERFGGGKLGALLAPGMTVLRRGVLGLLCAEGGLGGDVWLVGRPGEVGPWLGDLADEPRVHLVEAPNGGGQGDSLAAGARALPEKSALLVVLGDQPLAAPGAVAAVLGRMRGTPGVTAATAASGGRRMPPVAFGAGHRPALERLTGDEGARSVLSAASPAVVELGAGAWALDLDRPEDLPQLRAAARLDPIVARALEGPS